jgi:hypothetical protein
VEIDDAEGVVVEILLPYPVADRAEIVAEVEVPSGLDAREDTLDLLAGACAGPRPVLLAR